MYISQEPNFSFKCQITDQFNNLLKTAIDSNNNVYWGKYSIIKYRWINFTQYKSYKMKIETE